MTDGLLSATITLNCRHDAFTDIRNVGDSTVRLTGLSGHFWSGRTFGAKVLDAKVKYEELLSLGFLMPRIATHLSVCFFFFYP